ncbi:MAG: hypothetical protein JRJ47_07000, partial [Deltaproteobacteria bacterium]|nr:hypothetical protein [Deltaproteobacteria bacterium]
MYSTSIVDNISELNKQEWDTLSFENVFSSYGWLKTAEVTYLGDISPKYIVVKDGDELKAAAVCYVFGKSDLV